MTTAQPLTHADIRINARWIIPVVPENTVLEEHAVILRGSRILAVVPRAQADREYQCRETLDLDSHVVMPGLINMHGHAAMTLFRGMADDLPLMTWLSDHIWPAEQAFVSESFILDGTRLAMAEMLRTGTTTFSDMYFFPEVVAEAARELGMRAQVCFPVIDFPTAWGSGPDDYLRKGADLISRWQADDYIMPGIGPHAPYTVSDGPLAEVRKLAEATGTRIQIHLHETASEVNDAVQQNGQRPVSRLADAGLLGSGTQCVHMTQVNDQDLALLAGSGAHVVHCPESNLKLASGLCPVQALMDLGVNVAIGTDGAASNNDLDLFGELGTAAMLAKVVSGDPSALSAHQALAMATINGARALGREQELGSLEAGKLADLIAVDLSDPFMQPVYDPASHVIYSNHGRAVSHCWIHGVQQLKDGTLTRLDPAALQPAIQAWQKRIRAHQSG